MKTAFHNLVTWDKEMVLSFWEKQNPTEIIKLRRKHHLPPNAFPWPQSHTCSVLRGRYSFQCVFCLMLVFQHPQLEERKVSTGLGHSQTTLTRARQASRPGARNSPQLWTPSKSSQDKMRGLIPLLNSPESLQATFKRPEPYKHQ